MQRTSLAKNNENETRASQSQLQIGQESQQLNSVMNELVHLRKQRAKWIKRIENFESEQSEAWVKEFETPKSSAKDSKTIELRREREKLAKEIRKMKEKQQKLEKKLRSSENQFKGISMEIKVKQKQKDDLLIFKKKSLKNKENCNADSKLIQKYRAKSSTQLIEKIKKLSRKHSLYTEKDRVIYNQLPNIENKQVTYTDQVGVIKANKRAVTRHLTTCDEKIRVLSLKYFDDFRDSLEGHFAQFEPNFSLDTSLVEITQQSFVWEFRANWQKRFDRQGATGPGEIVRGYQVKGK